VVNVEPRLGSSGDRGQEDATAGSSSVNAYWRRALGVGLGAAGVALTVWMVRTAVSLRAFFQVNGELRTPSQTRRYLLHVPASHDPDRAAPLVVVIHGFMQSPAHQQQMTRWDDLADTEDFITVYPMGAGFPLRWPSHEPGTTSAETRAQVEFIGGLVDELCTKHRIDRDRVYASGMSNGGGLACALAHELPDVFAAVGSVAGLYTYPAKGPSSGRSVPLIAFHGDLDRIVPIEGGVERLGYPVPAVAVWMADYADSCGCTKVDTEQVDATVERVRYSGGPHDAEVVWYRVGGAGHTWPGGVPLPEAITGPTSAAVDATRLTWEFFERHPATSVRRSP